MDYKVILNLMKEMNNTDLTKLEIEEEGIKIRMEKAAPSVVAASPAFTQPAFVPQFMPEAVFTPQSAVKTQTEASTAQTQAADGSDKQIEEVIGKKLVSPMVGTYYASSAPDKPVFVKVGDKVKKGQTICIIEAMKLMNEIESELDGEIVKILVNNEEMVEYGQPLFLIK